MYCKKCGTKLEENTKFCGECGQSIESVKSDQSTNVLAIVGFVVACISLLLNFWGIVGIAAVVLSSLGLMQIAKTGENGKKLAVAGIAIGIVSIVYAFVLLLIMM